MLNDKSVIPLYYQLKEIVKEQIKDGSLKEGQKVPSERELMEMYNISRATARKALDDLMIEGLIERKQGLGTFVAPKKVAQDLTGDISFVRQILNQGLEPSVKVIQSSIDTEVPTRIVNLFKIDPLESMYKISAVAYVNKSPLIFAVTYLPLKLDPNIEMLDIENTILLEYLQNDLNIRFTHSTLEMEPILLDEFHAEYLNSNVGMPALSVERIYYSEDKIILIEKRVVPGDRLKYLFTLKHDTNEDKDYSLRIKLDKEYGENTV